MNYKILSVFITLIFLFNFISAVETLGYVEQDKCVNLVQSYSNSTYTNLTKIQYPNKTIS
jgi:hypothetical protein